MTTIQLSKPIPYEALAKIFNNITYHGDNTFDCDSYVLPSQYTERIKKYISHNQLVPNNTIVKMQVYVNNTSLELSEMNYVIYQIKSTAEEVYFTDCEQRIEQYARERFAGYIDSTEEDRKMSLQQAIDIIGDEMHRLGKSCLFIDQTGADSKLQYGYMYLHGANDGNIAISKRNYFEEGAAEYEKSLSTSQA